MLDSDAPILNAEVGEDLTERWYQSRDWNEVREPGGEYLGDETPRQRGQ